MSAERACAHCHGPIPDTFRRNAVYCSNACRQGAYDERQRRARADLLSAVSNETSEPDESSSAAGLDDGAVSSATREHYPDPSERLHAAVEDALVEDKLLAIVASAARTQWRAATWLLAKRWPERYGDRVVEVPVSPVVIPYNPDDPFREVDELRARREQQLGR